MSELAVPGTLLRLTESPSIRGRATGASREVGSFTYIEVEIGPNDRKYYRDSQLERDVVDQEPIDLYGARSFGTPADLRRRLSVEKMSGVLTDVLYSMGNSNTEFMPHQYKPVIKFIESPFGRLLIADEVGLGKTIESIYIWQEIQARSDARRLLIVCPSMLREKWKDDLHFRFGIDDCLLVDAGGLLDLVEPVLAGMSSKAFVAIASLEGIRVREEDADESSSVPREKLAGLLRQGGKSDDEFPFDLVIVDEAHYLRNSSTASHQVVEIIRDSTRNLILLSATPLQTREENLFTLLRLLAPEHFSDQFVFLQQFSSNTKIMRIVSEILGGSRAEVLLPLLRQAREDTHFAREKALEKAERLYGGGTELGLEDRVELGRSIEALSLFAGYYTRSRKRDVFVSRTVRTPTTVAVRLSEAEMAVYQAVSDHIRDTPRRGGQTDVFRLIMRQRQLASSIYAALKGWKKAASVADVDEELWEDLGSMRQVEGEKRHSVGEGDLDIDFDLVALRQGDSKYRGFRKAILTILSANPDEKVVVFSYYRATIAYLVERLAEDGIAVLSLVGGMGDERWKTIERFRDEPQIRILVSSEVGSEGIDLQFCRYLFNYDLPWNPMRLEQRIGRLDRIGQKFEKIMIYNLECENTIEDRVIMRLYERIEIFRNAIGDMEDILGDYVDDISRIMLDPGLTDSEREEALRQSEQALEERRQQTARLEEESIDLYSKGMEVLHAIDRDRMLGRWVGPEDLLEQVKDFFCLRYPQTAFSAGKVGRSLMLLLSREARESLGKYIEREKPAIRTRLVKADKPLLCLFDPQSNPRKEAQNSERIGPTHPLLRWIAAEYEANPLGLHSASAIVMHHRPEGMGTGIYAYIIQRWAVKGIKERREQRFFLISLMEDQTFSGERAEVVLTAAAKEGVAWHDSSLEVPTQALESSRDRLIMAAGQAFERFVEDFRFENDTLSDRQIRYAELSHSRRHERLAELIRQQRASGKDRAARMNQGKIDKLDGELRWRISLIESKRQTSEEFKDISMGLLKII